VFGAIDGVKCKVSGSIVCISVLHYDEALIRECFHSATATLRTGDANMVFKNTTPSNSLSISVSLFMRAEAECALPPRCSLHPALAIMPASLSTPLPFWKVKESSYSTGVPAVESEFLAS
jgi:hypothetical protein